MKNRTRDNTGRMVGSKELQTAIKETRKANGLSQKRFAEMLHVNELTVYRWESLLRVPHQVQLARLLKIAPLAHRHVFESYLEKTLQQVLYEDYMTVAKQGPSVNPDWGKNPLEHAGEICDATFQRVNLLWSEARSGSESSARSLLKVFRAADDEMRRAQREGWGTGALLGRGN